MFQDEKYYLLKKNVEIISDELELNAQIVKIFFENDLYDIKELIANEDVTFKSELYNITGNGNNVKFNIKNQEILVNGKNSKLFLENTEMMSDGNINLNNLLVAFSMHYDMHHEYVF